ncbi:hypothetical protein ID858_12245 [Xenorhabdus sp. DI]|uniref:putative quinol monooxygenase n=1 Tax=Xenorhabdus doucetiae TaxID=351671 RepID=UPI0019B3A6BC|nr:MULTISPECIES: hypothetical protein [unclassified Xenorhabdus]MBD2784461.1 hypothetical protein [Xenorhabdus sp. 3]MBD2789279.1 hypothetical protein [Xenorhabdus sp. DI]
MSINIVVFIKPEALLFNEFGGNLSVLREMSLLEDDCDLFDFYIYEDKYVLIERWKSQKGIDYHMKQDYTLSFIEKAKETVITTEVFRLKNFQ